MTLLLKGPFPGSSTLDGYEGWTEIESLQWGAGRGIAPGVAGGPRTASPVSVSEVTITKSLDISTAAMASLLGADEGVTIQIVELRTQPGQRPFPELLLELSNTLISGFSSSSGGDRPSESYSLNFEKLTATVKMLDPFGVTVDAGTYTFDAPAGAVGTAG